jgi:hypothetical protein
MLAAPMPAPAENNAIIPASKATIRPSPGRIFSTAANHSIPELPIRFKKNQCFVNNRAARLSYHCQGMITRVHKSDLSNYQGCLKDINQGKEMFPPSLRSVGRGNWIRVVFFNNYVLDVGCFRNKPSFQRKMSGKYM